MLPTLLSTLNLTQRELCRGAGLSKSVASRLVTHGEWPRRDPEAPARIRDFLAGKGADPKQLENIFSKEKAPDVLQHAEAAPEAHTCIEPLEDSMLLRNENLTHAAKQHFGLPRSPFLNEISTAGDVFSTKETRYVRAALMDAALNHGFIGLVCESGGGKTTLVDDLEQRILDEAKPVIVIRPYVLSMEESDTKGRKLKSDQITESIIRTLVPGVPLNGSQDERFRQLHKTLIESRKAGFHHLLVVDEAHCLPMVTMKHLKRFLELKHGRERLMGVCLVGQPELKSRLSEQNPEVREVVQRCEILEMGPLDGELEAYLKHKFERIGVAASSVLADNAYDAMRARLIRMPRGGKASDAVSVCYPLVVNNLVSRAMNAAAQAGWEKVDANVIGAC